jgi:hypothetical protein
MKLYLLTFLTIFLTTLLNAAGVNEQNQKIEIKAVRCNEPIKIDGQLTEAVWQNGYCIENFVQRDPVEGGKPTERTEVRIVYDDDALYVGAHLYDTSPDSIAAKLGRKDADIKSDLFGIFIDPYHDKRSGYYFGLSAGGTLLDGVLMNDDWDDSSWDGVWEGEARIDDQGWIAEMRIPFSQLRFKKKESYVWGVNLRRDISRRNEYIYLVFTPKDGSGFVSRFPNLVGIENINPDNSIEALPYVRAKGEYTHPDENDPFNDGSRYLPGLGVDFKYGISSNLTLNATINPDFGQVEVDPAVVNLSDVESYFDEKRPFFLEGASIFEFGYGGSRSHWSFNWSSPTFFYSRRIGRAPQGTGNLDYDYIDAPEGTTILGAAKLSGKLADNWNIGAIHAVTAREYADVEYENDRSEKEIEPLTHYSVIRAQKEINEGYRGIGIIATSAIRDYKNDWLKDYTNSKSLAFGLDGWTFLDNDRTWVVSSWAGYSNVQGNKNRIMDVQQSSRHYYQRPDAKYVSLDSNATKIQGFAGRILINKQKGNVFFNSALGVIHPGFDVSDVGFMWRTNIINYHLGAGYKWTKPNKICRYTELIGAVFNTWDFDGYTTWSGFWSGYYTEFANYYWFNIHYAYNPETYNNYRTRGGPLTKNLPGNQVDMYLGSDSRKPIVFEIGGYNYVHTNGTYDREVEFEIEWKPMDNINFSFNPGYSWSNTETQWIDVFDDETANETFDKRYVFASLDYKQIAASIRLNWTFNPKLSLQLYMQPLIASADFSEYKYLDRPKTYDFTEFEDINYNPDSDQYKADADGDGPAPQLSWDKPDFTSKSLRGNVVLRWEYLPGSVAYLVWTQSRYNDEENGNFNFGKSVDQLIDTRSDNIFMIKLTYWLNI